MRSTTLGAVLGVATTLLGTACGGANERCDAVPRAAPAPTYVFITVPATAPLEPSAAPPATPPGLTRPPSPPSVRPLPAFGPPPPRPLDATLPRPWSVDMLGANDTHAWLALATLETPRRQYSAVLDLATGCFTESVPQPVRVSQLEGLTFLSPFDRSAGIAGRRQAQAEAALADPATQSELRSYLGLAARFGRHSLQTWAWSTDGSKILALPAEGAFRSRDGGQSFEHVDSNMSRSPFVTRDGRWAFYERCSDASVHNYSCPAASREVAIFATADAAPPRHVPLGRGTIAGLDPTGQKLVIIRDDEPMKVTVMHVEPQAGNIEHAFSIPARALPKNKFFTIDTSRGGRYGTYDSVDYPVTKLTLVSMVEKRAVHTFQGSDFGNVEVDEEGRIAWWGFSDKHTHAAPPTGVVRDLGAGEPVGWASGGRLLMYEYPKPPPNHPSGNTVPQPPGTLGENACKLVRVRSVLR